MSELKPVTLVMVDDNIDEIFLTRRQVRREGVVNHFVSERKAENLVQTLTELQNSTDDITNVLILLDINMPRQDGFETLKQIRSHHHFGDIPVIMFSASDDEADAEEAFAQGANAYLVKPFKMSEFVGALATIGQVKYSLVA